MWFRRDLRLQDNKALAHALQNSAADELILLFQMNPQQFIQESANHNAFFASLASFKERIDSRGTFTNHGRRTVRFIFTFETQITRLAGHLF